MTPGALILTYHAVEEGPAPLCVSPEAFRAHLDCIAESGVSVMTVSALARALLAGELSAPAVAITFDDGLASTARTAAPMLIERELTATVYCVAGHLGRTSDWASRRAGDPTRPLARGDEVRALSAAGWEIGAHGVRHEPLHAASAPAARAELAGSRERLEDLIGAPVRSFAYPYGALPSPAARRVAEEVFTSACTTRVARLGPGVDAFGLPRVDAHYLRSPGLLRRALRGRLDAYLLTRRAGARVRRLVVSDHSRGRSR